MFSSGSSSTSACTAPARYPLQYSPVCCDLLHDIMVFPVSESGDDDSYNTAVVNSVLYSFSFIFFLSEKIFVLA
jgi:hypothetical protein